MRKVFIFKKKEGKLKYWGFSSIKMFLINLIRIYITEDIKTSI